MKKTSFEQFQAGSAELFRDDGKIEQLATGCVFAEGPLWHREGFLIFSDTPANKIKKLEKDGNLSDFILNSGCDHDDLGNLSDMIGSNGLAYDCDGRIVVCQHGNHSVGYIVNNNIKTLIPGFANRPFNSPNDITVRSTGHVYFSDPPYGLKDQVLNTDEFQAGGAVYLYKDAKVQKVVDQLMYPNGLCLSPDERFLYVSSNNPDEPNILKCTLEESGTISSTEIFMEQNADGIKTDTEGNLYMATDHGLMVADPLGIILCLLHFPETPSNLAWGGIDKNELYITARSSIYSVKTNVTGFMGCW